MHDDAHDIAERMLYPDALGDSMTPAELAELRTRGDGMIKRVAGYIRCERSDPQHAAAWALGRVATKTDDPEPDHFAAARAALDHASKHNPPDATVDALARAVHGELPQLRAWVSTRDAGDAEQDGMLAHDARFVAYLRRMGPAADPVADSVAQGARTRFAEYQQRRAAMTKPDDLRADLLWAYWGEPRGADPTTPRWLVALALAAWLVRTKPAIDLASKPAPSYRRIISGSQEFVTIGRSVSALSWALGGDGVVLDGDQYAHEPDLLNRQVPRSWALLPHGASKRPHQLVLPLADGATVPLMLAVTDGSSGAVIPPLASKLLLVMMAGARPSGAVACTLGELHNQVYPDAERRRQRDLISLGNAIKTLGDLRLVLPDGSGVPLFVVQAPVVSESAHAEQQAGWEIPALFVGRVAEQAPQLRGWFLINLSGAMRLDTRRPQLLRQYVRAASVWNDAHDPQTNRFDPARVAAYTLDTWAMLNNLLSAGAVEYATSRQQSMRRYSSADRRTTRDSLDELADAELIRIETRNRGRELLILPPLPYLDAQAQTCKTGQSRGRSQQRR